jgi:hypothetical protein
MQQQFFLPSWSLFAPRVKGPVAEVGVANELNSWFRFQVSVEPNIWVCFWPPPVGLQLNPDP